MKIKNWQDSNIFNEDSTIFRISELIKMIQTQKRKTQNRLGIRFVLHFLLIFFMKLLFPGANCFLLIEVSDLVTVHNLTSVDIIGLNGSVVMTLPLSPVPSQPGLYSAANFTSPAQFFHLGVSHQLFCITIRALESELRNLHQKESPCIRVGAHALQYRHLRQSDGTCIRVMALASQ